MKFDLSNHISKQQAIARFKKLLDRGAKMEMKEHRPKRSIQHNKYFHVVVGYFCAETGYTLEEGKVVLKRTYGRYMVYEKDGIKFLRSTADCDDKELSEFIDWIRNEICYNQLGVYVPNADEYYQNQFEVERELNGVLE